MKEWLENLDTTNFEENLKRVGFSKHQINMIKARVETYILPQILAGRVEPEVKVNFAEEMYKAIKFTLDYDKREIRENDDYEVSFLYPANNLSYQKLLKAVKMYEDSKISA